jgi:predicted oxidoreductase
MKKREALSSQRLGRSGLEVSRLAYGCWRIAGTMDPALVTGEREQAGVAAVRAAYECGFTFFDLADIYCQGRCEEIFGKVLREVSGMRGRVVVATKCGIRFKGEPEGEAPYRYDSTAAHIQASCEASLRRLGIEAIDLFMLHRPDWLTAPEEVAAAFSRLKEQGKVREFGVSNFRPSQVAMLQRACPMPLVVNQVEIHILQLESFSDGTLDQCLTEGMTPMAWSPLAGGRLVDPNPIDLHSPGHALRIRVREVMDQVARELGVTRTGVALAWLMKHPVGIVPIIGSTHPDRVRESVAALGIELTREQWYRILEAAVGQRLP